MIISRSDLAKAVASNQSAINEQRLFSNEVSETSVFLSHKHQDTQVLYHVKSFLENQGVKAYVDWQDVNMKHPTNAQTANDLKKKIEECDKFIFIATEAALESTWCSWEIGIGDRMKLAACKMAIFPIKEDNRAWMDHEYLRIYPHIEYKDGTTCFDTGKPIPKGYYVETPTNTGKYTLKPLKTWLKS